MKKVFVAILMVVAILLTFHSFNQMNEKQFVSGSQIILEENQELVLNKKLTVDSNKRLVPIGAILGEGEVNEVKVSYFVEMPDIESIGLKIEIKNVLIGNDNTYSDLVNISIIQTSVGKNANVEAIITLNMPASEVEYRSLLNQPITFNLVFTAQVL